MRYYYKFDESTQTLLDFSQEYVDVKDFLLVNVVKMKLEDQDWQAEYGATSECEVFDAKLSDKFQKSLCLPKTREMQLYGDIQLGFGRMIGLEIRPKCFVNE